jgi:hypothetical protein
VDNKDTTKNKNMNVHMDEVTLNIPTQVQLVDRLLKIFLSFYWPQLRDFLQLYMIIDSDTFEYPMIVIKTEMLYISIAN